MTPPPRDGRGDAAQPSRAARVVVLEMGERPTVGWMSRSTLSMRHEDEPMYNSYEGPTTLGIPERWERVLCYALFWLSGLVLLIVEQRNQNVRRHAAQSVLVFGTLSILLFVVGLFGGWFGAIPLLGFFFGFGFGLVAWLVKVGWFVLWLVLIVIDYARPTLHLAFGLTSARPFVAVLPLGCRPRPTGDP